MSAGSSASLCLLAPHRLLIPHQQLTGTCICFWHRNVLPDYSASSSICQEPGQQLLAASGFSARACKAAKS